MAKPKMNPGDKGNEKATIDAAKFLVSLAKAADVGREDLERRIEQARSAFVEEAEHLTFSEAASPANLAAERRQHLDGCRYCQGLADNLEAREEVTETFLRALPPVSKEPWWRWRPSSARSILLPAIAALAMVLLLGGVLYMRQFAGRTLDTVDREIAVVKLAELERAAMQNPQDFSFNFAAADLRLTLHQAPEASEQIVSGLMKCGVDRSAVEALNREITTPQVTDANTLLKTYLASTRFAAKLKDQPAQPDAYLRLTRLQWQSGQAREAYDTALAYLSVSAKDRRALAQCAPALRQVGKGSAARERFAGFVAKPPGR
jgi:hypothetical protein